MKTVMVVDDSRIMRGIVKKTFDQLNIPVNYLEAGDGNLAMQILSENKIDLILLDWNIPGMSGIDFLKQIKAIEEYKNIPVVMVTSEAAKLNIIEAVKTGATAYVIKPIDDKIFMEKISKISF